MNVLRVFLRCYFLLITTLQNQRDQMSVRIDSRGFEEGVAEVVSSVFCKNPGAFVLDLIDPRFELFGREGFEYLSTSAATYRQIDPGAD